MFKKYNPIRFQELSALFWYQFTSRKGIFMARTKGLSINDVIALGGIFYDDRTKYVLLNSVIRG